MKKLICGLLLAIALAIGGIGNAAVVGDLEYKIDESMPQTAEPFNLMPYGGHSNNIGSYLVILGSSIEDPMYMVYYIIVDTKTGFHVIGMGTMQINETATDLENMVNYGDLGFLKTGVPTDTLEPIDHMIPPEELDQIPGAKGTAI